MSDRVGRSRTARFATAFTIVALLATASLVLPMGGSSKTEVLRVRVDGPADVAALGAWGAELIADYHNGYALVRVPEGKGAYLARSFEVENMDLEKEIELAPSGISFRSDGALPEVPAGFGGLRAQNEYLVQFAGPIMKEWTDEVRALGGELFDYYAFYTLHVRLDPSKVDDLRALPYVGWVGDFSPAYKVAGDLLSDDEGSRLMTVRAYPEVDALELSGKLDGMGATVFTITTEPPSVTLSAPVRLIPDIASLGEVRVVHPESSRQTLDSVAGEIHKYHYAWYPTWSGLPAPSSAVGQTTSLTGRMPGPDSILYNSDDVFEIGGVFDSGFDVGDANDGHLDFFDSPNGDRIIAYYAASSWAQTNPDGWGSGCEPHGTACAGIIASDGYAWETKYGLSKTDKEWHESEAGVAPEAQLTIAGAPGPGGAGILGWLAYQGSACAGKPCWDRMYLDDGARTISNSWGGWSSYEPALDERIDKWNDLMILMAAGNSGPSSDTIGDGLAKNKNGLTVGASQNYRPEKFGADNPNVMASFSSRGGTTTSFGRVKPDIVAIGTAGITTMGPGGFACNGWSPQADYIMEVDEYNYTTKGPGHDGINDYRYFSGTSQATPMTAGNYMLIREYLREVKGIAAPSSSLAKALLINGAVRMNADLYDYPGYDQGWGRVNVKESMFPTPPRTNQFVQGTFATTGTCDPLTGACTGAGNSISGTMNTDVFSGNVPLKVTLVWIDGVGEALVRDIDLKVTSPSGVEYRGNAYNNSGQYRGWSAPDPAVGGVDNPKWAYWDSNGNNWDNLNVVEQVEVKTPEAGTWQVELIGANVPLGLANYSLVFSADIGPQASYRVDLTSGYPPIVSVALGGTVAYPVTVTNYGSSADSISMSAATGSLGVSFIPVPPYSLQSLESRDAIAVIKADDPSLTSGIYPVRLIATSNGDPTVQDFLKVTVEVLGNSIPPPIRITTDTTNDVDPSVLVFEEDGVRHIFIAYIKTTSINGMFGGDNVWMAHTTLDGNGIPVEPWDFREVSNLNDIPKDPRLTYFESGTYRGRVILTWTGYDPAWGAQQMDYGSWGRVAYSDPPYDNWNVVTIDENSGEQVTNAKRASFAMIRESTQQLIYVFEYLGSPSSEDQPSIVQTWYSISTDGGATWSAPPLKLFPPPGPNMFYFFPTGCVDQNEVAWVFAYFRTPNGNDRDLRAAVYDGTWSTTPMIWDTSDNVQFPSCMSTAEGAAGNRIYFGVSRDLMSVDKTVWLGWTDGDYTSSTPPADAPVNGMSASFTPTGDGFGRNGPGALGAYTVALSDANYDRGPLIVLLNTSELGGETIWTAYMENSHLEVPPYPATPYDAPNLWTLHTSDGFATQPGLIRVTADAFAKGHKMADSLQVNGRGLIYETFHSNKGDIEMVDYNIYLTIYDLDWESMPDVMGPRVDNVVAIENPYNVTDPGFDVYASLNDAVSGMSGIEEAVLSESPTSVSLSEDVDWSISMPMTLTGNKPTEVASLSLSPVAWIPGEVHRLWVRGKDSAGNWGRGDFVDVAVVGPGGALPGAPTLTGADLGGIGDQDVVLTWILSPDDALPSFEGYEVYAGSFYSSGRLSYSLLTPSPLPSGTNTWTHSGAGVGDIDDHFYVVVAKNLDGARSASNQGAKLVTHYQQGARLVSIPLELATDDIAAILDTLSYDIAWWYDPTDAGDHWKSYSPSKPFNDLSRYNLTMAVWVDVASEGDLTVAGLVPQSTDISIYAGWNLIGYPSFSSKTVSNVLSTISCDRVEGYDGGAPPWNLELLDDGAFMSPRGGYWVRASSPGTFTLSNP